MLDHMTFRVSDIGRTRQFDGRCIARRTSDRTAIEAFHAAALAAGARDNGPPGLRPHCHPTCYGAFVVDPDGSNIEAVCHPPARARRAAQESDRTTAR